MATSAVRWNGAARPTTFVSSTQLQVTIAASDITTAGTAQVTVVTPAPGGGTSAALAFTINNPAPTLGSLRSEEHTSELQSRLHLVCRLLLEKKKTTHR